MGSGVSQIITLLFLPAFSERGVRGAQAFAGRETPPVTVANCPFPPAAVLNVSPESAFVTSSGFVSVPGQVDLLVSCALVQVRARAPRARVRTPARRRVYAAAGLAQELRPAIRDTFGLGSGSQLASESIPLPSSSSPTAPLSAGSDKRAKRSR